MSRFFAKIGADGFSFVLFGTKVSDFLRFMALILIFSPLLLNLYDLLIALIQNIEELDYFFRDTTLSLIKNSTLISMTIATISCLLGGILAILFFALSSNLKRFYILLLFTFFAIEPIIYLSAFQQNILFGYISPFWQSVVTVSLSMIALCGLIFIFALSFINQESIRVASMVASKRDILRLIIKPQLVFIVLLAFFMVFLLVFSSSEVSSILGYRTYAEDFLAQISLMDNLNQTAIATVPFYILAMVSLIILGLFTKRYSIKFQIKERIDFLLLSFINQKVILFLFTLLVFLFLSIVVLLGMQIDFSQFGMLVKENRKILFDSLVLAFVVASIAVIFSVFIYRTIEKIKNIYLIFTLVALVFLTFLTPSALIGFEVIKIMQFFNLHSEFTDYLFFVLSSSFKLIPIGVGLVAILYHKDVEDESLKFFSISKMDIFIKIVIPTYASRWLFVVMILCVFALNELSISILLIPIGFEVMIIKIYNLLHYGDYSTVTFLSLMQIFVIVLILILIRRITK
ncbi:Ferric iron ABC transporter, permease protein [hydrothermal vent metagenome]|uniref:Ferric iron ABC transporter, permease protein n=1 Tax=hydrothermal vent metagenome TaxID=652676 RepID=A0A1W1CEH6_9ZZZZ